MKIIGWKFGKEDVTVKYENENGAYTLKTENEPRQSLYEAAMDIADETKVAMGFKFCASLNSIAINNGEEITATITLSAATALLEKAEVKCPKISREQCIEEAALFDGLPNQKKDGIIFRYIENIELNLVIDVFLKEAEAFVTAQSKEEPGLFDNEYKEII